MLNAGRTNTIGSQQIQLTGELLGLCLCFSSTRGQVIIDFFTSVIINCRIQCHISPYCMVCMNNGCDYLDNYVKVRQHL